MAYAVLARISPGYPPPLGRFPCLTHPFAARRHAEGSAAVRLACVKHAASVQSEPGSNSSVQSSWLLKATTLTRRKHSQEFTWQCKIDMATSRSRSIQAPTQVIWLNC